jgi:hypothetical protein
MHDRQDEDVILLNCVENSIGKLSCSKSTPRVIRNSDKWYYGIWLTPYLRQPALYPDAQMMLGTERSSDISTPFRSRGLRQTAKDEQVGYEPYIQVMSSRVPTETTENKGIALRYPVLESKIGRS